jgi:hypothetical protein
MISEAEKASTEPEPAQFPEDTSSGRQSAKHKIPMGRSELTQEAFEAALKAEAR